MKKHVLVVTILVLMVLPLVGVSSTPVMFTDRGSGTREDSAVDDEETNSLYGLIGLAVIVGGIIVCFRYINKTKEVVHIKQ